MRTPALVANAALRNADWSAVIARYAARRLDEPPEALAPQLVAHIALGASSAAYSEWLRDEQSDLVELINRAFAMVQFEPEPPKATSAPPPAPGPDGRGGHQALRRVQRRRQDGAGSASLLIPGAMR